MPLHAHSLAVALSIRTGVTPSAASVRKTASAWA
jgi:hypothetical protein